MATASTLDENVRYNSCLHVMLQEIFHIRTRSAEGLLPPLITLIATYASALIYRVSRIKTIVDPSLANTVTITPPIHFSHYDVLSLAVSSHYADMLFCVHPSPAFSISISPLCDKIMLNLLKSKHMAGYTPPPTIILKSAPRLFIQMSKHTAPYSLAFDYGGNLYFSCRDNCIRRVSCSHVSDAMHIVSTDTALSTLSIPLNISTLIPTSTGRLEQCIQVWCGQPNYQGAHHDGISSIARFDFIRSMAFDNLQRLIVCDFNNNCVRRITKQGTVTTLAGNRMQKVCADGDNMNAMFSGPYGVVVDRYDNAYVTDSRNCCIRMVTSKGYVTTVADNGSRAFSYKDYKDGCGRSAGRTSGFIEPRAIVLNDCGYLNNDLTSTEDMKVHAPIVLYVSDHGQLCKITICYESSSSSSSSSSGGGGGGGGGGLCAESNIKPRVQNVELGYNGNHSVQVGRIKAFALISNSTRADSAAPPSLLCADSSYQCIRCIEGDI